MKILHTSEFYHPSVGGGQEVVRQLSERLATRGHEVWVATTRLPGRQPGAINGVRLAEFSVKGNLARGLSGEVEAYRKFVREGGFDVVMNYAAQQWTTDCLLPVMDEIRCAKVLVPCGFSGLYRRAFRGYFDAMRRWILGYDACVFLSADYRDILWAREAGVKRLEIIPNGAALEEFEVPYAGDLRRELGIAPDDFLVLLVGNHTGLKGHAEAIRIFRRSRIRKAVLLIAAQPGRWPCEAACAWQEAFCRQWPPVRSQEKKIMVRAFDRPHTVAAFQAADLFLFPSRIECSPLVLFEACAGKTPFLSTDVGNAREIAAWTGGGTIMRTRTDRRGYARADEKDGAGKLEDLWNDPVKLGEMAGQGHRAWSEKFTWDRITSSYEDLYRDLVSKR